MDEPLFGRDIVCDELLEVLNGVAPIDTALLPVNEDNFSEAPRYCGMTMQKHLDWPLRWGFRMLCQFTGICSL